MAVHKQPLEESIYIVFPHQHATSQRGSQSEPKPAQQPAALEENWAET